MSIRVTDNTASLKAAGSQKANLFLRLAAEGIGREADPKTPKKTGDLRRSRVIQVLGLHARISWGKRYAGPQEDTQFRHYTTPGTGPHYAENAVRKVAENATPYLRKAGLL